MKAHVTPEKVKQGLIKSARAVPLYVIAICMLLGFLAGCPSATGPSLGTNADLSDLTLSSGSLSPAFAASTTTSGVKSINICLD